MLVPIPAELSYTGKFRWDIKEIDCCIAPIVQALNDAGIYTSNCCCGHGRGNGIIALHDGRELIIMTSMHRVGEEQWIFDCPYHGREVNAFCFRALDERLVDNWKLFRFEYEQIGTTEEQKKNQLRVMRATYNL